MRSKNEIFEEDTDLFPKTNKLAHFSHLNSKKHKPVNFLRGNHMEYPLAVGDLIKKFYKSSSKANKEENYELAFNLFLETFTDKFNEAYEFVVCIANPKSRQEFIQSFEVNAASLYSSVTLGYSAEQICVKLLEFSKIQYLSPDIINFIHNTTSSYGKCRLVLMNNKYFLESENIEVVQYYFDLPNLKDCWNSPIYRIDLTETVDKDFSNRITADLSEMPMLVNETSVLKESNETLMKLIDEKADEDSKFKNLSQVVFRLEVLHEKIDKVRIDREGISRYKYMMSQEFDYLNTDEKTRLAIHLRPTAKLIKKNQSVPRTRDFKNVHWE